MHTLPARAEALGRQEWLPRAGGFEAKNWADLLAAVRRLADTVDAVEDRTNDYGTFYRIEGAIEGPIGKLSVVCISATV